MEEPKNPEEILVYEIYKSIATPAQLQEMGDGLRQGKLGYGHIKTCCWTPSLTKLKMRAKIQLLHGTFQRGRGYAAGRCRQSAADGSGNAEAAKRRGFRQRAGAFRLKNFKNKKNFGA